MHVTQDLKITKCLNSLEKVLCEVITWLQMVHFIYYYIITQPYNSLHFTHNSCLFLWHNLHVWYVITFQKQKSQAGQSHVRTKNYNISVIITLASCLFLLLFASKGWIENLPCPIKLPYAFQYGVSFTTINFCLLFQLIVLVWKRQSYLKRQTEKAQLLQILFHMQQEAQEVCKLSFKNT